MAHHVFSPQNPLAVLVDVSLSKADPVAVKNKPPKQSSAHNPSNHRLKRKVAPAALAAAHKLVSVKRSRKASPVASPERNTTAVSDTRSASAIAHQSGGSNDSNSKIGTTSSVKSNSGGIANAIIVSSRNTRGPGNKPSANQGETILSSIRNLVLTRSSSVSSAVRVITGEGQRHGIGGVSNDGSQKSRFDNMLRKIGQRCTVAQLQAIHESLQSQLQQCRPISHIGSKDLQLAAKSKDPMQYLSTHFVSTGRLSLRKILSVVDSKSSANSESLGVTVENRRARLYRKLSNNNDAVVHLSNELQRRGIVF